MSNSTATPFCAAAGGTWPAVQALIAFLITNIFAHAATIRLPPGANTRHILRIVFGTFLHPIYGGSLTFDALHRWLTRFKGQSLTLRKFFSIAFPGDSFEGAATAGALAILVPLRYAPLLYGRWEVVRPAQNTLMLDNFAFCEEDLYDSPENYGSLRFNEKTTAMFRRFVPFVLPPTTQFRHYKRFKISATSNILSQLIALVQVFFSARQLYLNYHSSVLQDGLSSPYVVVIPYLLMSLVNLITNSLVGSYSHVTLLPMVTKLPDPNRDPNRVFIKDDDQTPEVVTVSRDERPRVHVEAENKTGSIRVEVTDAKQSTKTYMEETEDPDQRTQWVQKGLIAV